ncbi:hypothetical protein ILYODFUR_018608 [Ilyodon furcidens]|uniref:Uncharacterized protein n=1 Tax=Ilyodon furcidens TaxID=33524 RepID=A0ABV0TXJ5_9TELE
MLSLLSSPCFKLLQNVFLDLSALFLGLHIAVCFLMFSNKPLRPSQSSWAYSQSRLYRWNLKGLTFNSEVSEYRGLSRHECQTFQILIDKKCNPCILVLVPHSYAPLCVGLSENPNGIH